MKIVKWLYEAREKHGSEISIILVGNKADIKSRYFLFSLKGNRKEFGM